jgi:putative transposase
MIEVISGILYPSKDRRFHMRKSRFTDSQIMAVLKQAEAGVKVPDLCREHGISSATFYKWRSKFGGMDTSMMKRLKELEDENRRLKKMYAEERLKSDLRQEALEGKWSGHLIAVRWPERQSQPAAVVSGLPVRPFPSARPVIGIGQSLGTRMQ